MGTLFKGWRRKSGIVSLMLAFVFAGAWVKSSFDKTVICSLNGNQVDELPMAGKIGVFFSSHRLQKLEVMGLYRDSLALSWANKSPVELGNPAPARVGVDFSSEIPPPLAVVADANVTPVSHQTVGNTEESVSSVSQSNFFAPPPHMPKNELASRST